MMTSTSTFKGILAVSVSIIATVFLGLLAFYKGSQEALGALIYGMSGILAFYFGMEGAKTAVKVSSREGGRLIKQELFGLSVKAIIAVTVGIGATVVLGYLAIQGNERAVGALITELSIVTGYYFGSDTVTTTT